MPHKSAEGNDAGHVQSPARKLEAPHLGFAHGISPPSRATTRIICGRSNSCSRGEKGGQQKPPARRGGLALPRTSVEFRTSETAGQTAPPATRDALPSPHKPAVPK